MPKGPFGNFGFKLLPAKFERLNFKSTNFKFPQYQNWRRCSATPPASPQRDSLFPHSSTANTPSYCNHNVHTWNVYQARYPTPSLVPTLSIPFITVLPFPAPLSSNYQQLLYRLSLFYQYDATPFSYCLYRSLIKAFG